MIEEIDQRIEEVKEHIDKYRELIIGINDAIENDDFQPSASQQVTIDYICQQGKSGWEEIERLEELKKQFE